MGRKRGKFQGKVKFDNKISLSVGNNKEKINIEDKTLEAHKAHKFKSKYGKSLEYWNKNRIPSEDTLNEARRKILENFKEGRDE